MKAYMILAAASLLSSLLTGNIYYDDNELPIIPEDPEEPEEPEIPRDPAVPAERTYLRADSVRRLKGSDRFVTSLYITEELRSTMGAEKFDAVILASGINFPDALAGGYLSYMKNAPVILTADSFGDTAISPRINEYIRNNLKAGGTVYVLGGRSAVSEAALKGLESFDVVRISGSDRYATNIEILKAADVTCEDLLVCTGNNYADSLSCSAAKKPVLMVDNRETELSEEQIEYLTSLNTENIYIIGGTAAVSEELELQLAEVTGANVERLSGHTRYETSTMVAEQFLPEAAGAVLVYSENFPDGLSGSLLAVDYQSPVILTKTAGSASAAEYAASHDIHSGYVIGGFGMISDPCARKIFGRESSYEIYGRIDSGFYTEDGKTYYYDASLRDVLKGEQTINGGKYYFDPSTGVMYKGFRNVSSGTIYYDDSGRQVFGWANIWGYTYYFDPSSGAMYIGKKNIGGKNYFFEDNGRMVDFSDTSSYLVVANKKHKLPSGYEPSDLSVPNVPMNYAGTSLRYTAARALERMFAAARNAGVTLILGSGYRSESYQRTLYNGYVARYGTATADTISSRPGYSDHQTGLAADISDHNGATYLTQSMENTVEGIWLRNHAHEYGFIMRYPKGKDSVTGYSYEPWHFRYVGVDYATKIYNVGVWYTFEEYFGVEGGGY